MSNTKTKQGKEKKWFQSSFNFPTEPLPKKLRKDVTQILEKSENNLPKENVGLRNSSVESYNWLEKYKPCSITELAVNNKKIQEVEDWLNKAVSVPGNNGMLLLSGPSGCGKTITIELAAKKLGLTISEWITPVDIDLVKDFGPNSYSYQEKQTDKFLDFLLKASRFRSLLCNVQSNRIVVVEDYPNIFSRDSSEFHNILQKYKDRGKSPIVFICTDSNDSGQSMLWNLFPPNVIEKFGIDQISFNPVAMTGMKQALKRITGLVSKTNNTIKIPDQESIEVIINSSMGDIRSAVNNLCFASLKGAVPMQTEIKSSKATKGKDKKAKDKNHSKLSCLGRNESLSVMHGVGRVLNPKFADKVTAKEVQKFTHPPQSIVEHFDMQPVSFVGYIHENYLPHFATISDVAMAADILSDADCFMNEWRDKAGKRYGLTVAVSGLMLANKTPVSSWHPIRGPKKSTITCPNIQDIPLLDPNQMICGKVLATDYKGFCTVISRGVTHCEDISLIEEYTISE